MKASLVSYSILFFCGFCFSQNSSSISVDAQFFRGNIIKHTNDVSHLITGHPDGFLVSVNKKTWGTKEWHQVYNYPDYGISFHYLDFKNNYLGNNVAVGVHYNFYFLNRNLMLRVSQGLGMTTNPYDRETNNKNNAFGTKIMNNTYFLLQYKKEYVFNKIGIQSGLMLTHFSNGRFKSPNKGINTLLFNIGLNYNFNNQQSFIKDSLPSSKTYQDRIKYNIAFRTGVSEEPILNIGQRMFYHIGFYIDKRISRKSAIQLGTDAFFSRYLQNFIAFASVAFPPENESYVNPNTDYKRIGLFIGHELFINNLSLETQLGYYVYKPLKYGSPVYQRLSAKYYLYKNIFTGIGLKTHFGKAEAIEATLGLRWN